MAASQGRTRLPVEKPAPKTGKPLKPKGIEVEDAGVVITLPSGHKETITTDEADELYTSLDDLLNDRGGI